MNCLNVWESSSCSHLAILLSKAQGSKVSWVSPWCLSWTICTHGNFDLKGWTTKTYKKPIWAKSWTRCPGIKVLYIWAKVLNFNFIPLIRVICKQSTGEFVPCFFTLYGKKANFTTYHYFWLQSVWKCRVHIPQWTVVLVSHSCGQICLLYINPCLG